MSAPAFSFRDIAVDAFGPTLLFSIGQGAILPIVALSARSEGASVSLSGLIVALIGVGSLVSNVPAALFIARYGERLSMVWAAALSSVALLLCLIPGQIRMLAIGVFMVGMASSVLLLARQTYLIEAVPLHMRARGMSLLGGMRRIGVFVGPFIGAGAMQLMGLAGAYWVGIVAMLASGALAFAIPDLEVRGRDVTATRNSPKLAHVLCAHWKTYCTLGLGILLVSGLRASRQIVIPLWANHLGIDPTTTSVIYGLVASVDMMAFYPSGMAMDRYGRLWVAAPSALIMGLATALEPAAVGLLSFLFVSMAIGLGNGIGSGLVMTIGADVSPREGRTQFLGIWRMFGDVGATATPVLLSAVTAVASLALGIAATGLLGVVAAVVFWRWLPRSVR